MSSAASPRYGKGTREIRTTVGDSFVLELSAHATSGHAWRVLESPGVTALTGERIAPAGAASGAASSQEFEFRATRPGDGTLVMAYGRPWESAPVEELRVTVTVRPPSGGTR